MDAEFEVRHAPERSRYEIWRGDTLVGFSDTRIQGGRALLPHVEIDPSFGGQGLGTRLVKESLDDLRAKGMKIVPICPFVGTFLRRHPEYADLVEG